ncbi:MAG: nucleotidyltransferase family protein [Rhizobiaceae bacterium]|nr:nucleotidyltransferase family protein [Rhizobiaceae bacterium]
MDHLRYASHPEAEQQRVFLDIIWADPLIRAALVAARGLELPDWLIVSGALYNTVWNHLTGRQPDHGINDIDLFYFDGSDLSYEAEDAVIRRAAPAFAHLPVEVEIRNQARVHLWYPEKFGRQCPQYLSSAHSVEYFASKTHAVGVRLGNDDRLELVAPFGVRPIFQFRMVPNRALDNRATHEKKSARAKSCWPELTLEPW